MKGSYSWYAVYANAILELDRSKLSHRVNMARHAIDLRIDDLESKGELLSDDERQDIDDALSDLRVTEHGIIGKSRVA